MRGYGLGCPGVRGIGYRELAAVGGAASVDVWEEIKRNTRRYAKRQMTFFRTLPGVTWIHADDHGTLRHLIKKPERP